MYFFDGWVTELLLDLVHEIAPAWVAVPWRFVIALIFGLVTLPVMDPPVLHRSFKVRGSKHHHQGVDVMEVVLESLEVCETIPEELVDIVVLSFEHGRSLEKDRFDT